MGVLARRLATIQPAVCDVLILLTNVHVNLELMKYHGEMLMLASKNSCGALATINAALYYCLLFRRVLASARGLKSFIYHHREF